MPVPKSHQMKRTTEKYGAILFCASPQYVFMMAMIMQKMSENSPQQIAQAGSPGQDSFSTSHSCAPAIIVTHEPTKMVNSTRFSSATSGTVPGSAEGSIGIF